MGALETAKTAEVYLDSIIESWEAQTDLLPLTEYEEPDGTKMQNANNSYWENVEQHSNIVEGDDLSGVTPTGIIQESVRLSLGTLKNVWTKQVAKDLRTTSYWDRKGIVDGKTMNQRLNTDIAAAVAIQGSLFYRSNVTSAFDFMSEGQMQMNERQLKESMRCFAYNDRDSGKFAKDLAARQTLQGRPEEVWVKGQVGQNINSFENVMTGAYLPTLAGGADPATTVTGAHSFAPEGGSVTDATNTVQNVDYRYAEIVVAASAGYNVGDKVKFVKAGTDIYALGVGDKNTTLQPMTFSVIAKADATHITIFPKPIALDDAALSDHEKAYANVDTTIENATVVTRLNIDALARTNLFWDKQSIKVVGGTLPVDKFQEFNAAKTITKSLSNGLPLYLMYDGDIAELSFRYRLTAWTAVNVVQPQNCGVAITYT